MPACYTSLSHLQACAKNKRCIGIATYVNKLIRSLRSHFTQCTPTPSMYYSMFFTFAQWDGNAEEAARRYAEEHPGQNLPSANTFRRAAARLYTSGSFQPAREGVGRSCLISTVRADEVLEEFDRDGSLSVRDASHRLGISRSSIHRILQENMLHPYKYVQVQHLNPGDYIQRIHYARWLVGKIERNPSFCKYVLWTDEALFIREGCFNAHNSHLWNDENPHAIRPRAMQARWSVNLWAGICGDFIVGPYILPDRLDG
nr:PREDICTED: uncharacterized protein LOC105662952 isoform X1 [Megachile rotundata]XP_012144547.1 PREDICTED: uncharacterized protein LOC105662952 isoform X1 [Megachile rotundata]XP_012144548.1 PREDICTED: uncharacterized protein LOC105662952 isoform X1 [Megachile rotundata]XP_012144549.1 PREDICTED: uncharacterized protein LOC105662952 isoform X1 [Megachile rotundata]XP_012144550.1 PREDICTED: uncharacterized protein LOC105662952 isoform X1 [Megachile rotundata]